MSIAIRAAKLSHSALVELVVAACESSPTIKNLADARVAAVAPLPAWCVEVLLSQDLLGACFSSLALSDCTAGVCRAWCAAWKSRLAVLRAVVPTVQRTIPNVVMPNGLSFGGSGVLAVSCMASRQGYDSEDHGRLCYRHVSALAEESGFACRDGADEPLTFNWPMRLVSSHDALFVSDGHLVRKFGQDGTELATYAHPNSSEEHSRPDTALHQPSGSLFAVVELEDGCNCVLQLDAASLEPRLDADGQPKHFGRSVLDAQSEKHVAIDGDHVLVTEVTEWNLSQEDAEAFTANVLHVFSLDGTLVRTIEGCGYGPPRRMVGVQGRLYLVENRDKADEGEWEFEWAGRQLFIIDLETGDVLQVVRIEAAMHLSDVAVHDGSVYLSDWGADCIFVLKMAEAAAPA